MEMDGLKIKETDRMSKLEFNHSCISELPLPDGPISDRSLSDRPLSFDRWIPLERRLYSSPDCENNLFFLWMFNFFIHTC